jgi:hypothetical protein
MSAKKDNDKKEKNSAGCCGAGMTEMMRGCCPDGAPNADCFTRMKEMGEKFWNPKTGDPGKGRKRGAAD